MTNENTAAKTTESDTQPAPDQQNDTDQAAITEAAGGEGEGHGVEFVVEGEESSQTPGNDTVPVAVHIDLKKKLRQEKQQNQESSQTLENVQQENELLRAQLKLQNGQTEEPQMPTLESCDGDEERYNTEMAAYQDHQINKRVDARMTEHSNTQATTAQQEQFDERLDSGLQKHQEQAAEFKIPDYGDALSAFSAAFGSKAAEQMIADESINAPTVYHLWKNPQKMQNLANMVRVSPLKAAISIGELKASIVPKNKSGEPPPPADKLDGGNMGANSFQQRVDAMRKQGGDNVQDILAIKREAQEAGVTVV